MRNYKIDILNKEMETYPSWNYDQFVPCKH